MDPNANPPMDPKLKEVYDRVMGVSGGDTGAASQTLPTPQATQPTNTPTTPTASQPDATSASPLPSATPQAATSDTPPSPLLDVSLLSATPETTPVDAAPSQPTGAPTAATIPIPPATSVDLPQQPVAPTQSSESMDALKATMNMPSLAPQETVQIGLGGSPVAPTEKVKKKGVPPLLIIFGALIFLIAYAIFWARFFGLQLPFLP